MTDDSGTRDYHGFRTPPISVDKAEWKRFGEIVGPRQRAEVLRQFISWYVGKPGAKMPRRPTTADGPHS